MLRYLYGDELDTHPRLRDTMFRDRATQFADRLGWAVTVDGRGEERDDYDAMNPLYVIRETAEGRHGGSMRFLPTTGRTMVNDHFTHLTDGVEIRSPFIWECTRFCLAPEADPRTAPLLMAACGEIMRGFSLDHLVGVFDRRMVRIYRRIGAPPEVIGSAGTGRTRISVGLWSREDADADRVHAQAGITAAMSARWFAAALDAAAATPAVA